LSLEGLGGKDRGCNAAQTLGRFSGTTTLTFCALGNAEVDSLVTISEGRFAELSTMPLRWRPLGRCAASWITSGMVSGGELLKDIPKCIKNHIGWLTPFTHASVDESVFSQQTNVNYLLWFDKKKQI
jgi:hypothetical protein